MLCTVFLHFRFRTRCDNSQPTTGHRSFLKSLSSVARSGIVPVIPGARGFSTPFCFPFASDRGVKADEPERGQTARAHEGRERRGFHMEFR
jgi:hypothetical protein